MPLILRLAQRYISRRLFQSILFIVGVALGVAMVIAIDLANGSASRAFSLSTESITGRTTHQIIGGPGGLPTEVYHQVRVDLGIRASAPIVEDYVRVVELGDQPLRVLGVDSFAEAPFRSYLTTVEAEGQNQVAFDALNAFIAQPGTLLISETLAQRFGIESGDSITVRARQQRVIMQVVGLLRPNDSVSEQALDNLLLMDISTAQELVGQPDRISRVDLILPDGYDLAPIESILPQGAVLTTPSASNNTVAQMTAAFELNLQALSLLALVVGVFLIYNTVTFSVVQRRPIIGVMRALGTTRRQIFMLILGEAAILGLIGTIIGLGLGIIFGRAAVGLVTRTISDLYFTVSVQGLSVAPFTLLKGAAIGMTASLIAALIPSIEATRTPPAGTLRRSDFEEQTIRLVPFMTVGAVLMNVIGIVLLQLPTQSLIISFAALFFILIGCALFTPIILVTTMKLVVPITSRLFGVLGRMAPRAVSRSLSRTAVAVAALTVAVSVIVGVSVMISSFRTTVADWLDTTLGADIFISPPSLTATRVTADVDASLVDTLLAVDGVISSATARTVNVTAPAYPLLPPVSLVAVSTDISGRERAFAWNNAPNGDHITAMKEGNIVVSEPFAYRRDISTENNQLILLTDRGEHIFTVIGVFYDYGTDQGTVLMDDAVYRTYYDDPYISSVALYIAPDSDTTAIIDDLRTKTLVGQDLQVQSNRTLRASVFDVFDRAFSITIALQVLATVVAFIGILSALMALQLEHTREYGVMRANGMTPGQLTRYTLIQTGLMGTTAGIMALPIGLVLALVLVYVINVRSFGWTMQLMMPPQEFIQAFAVALIASLLAGLYPARRLSKLVTARALRSE